MKKKGLIISTVVMAVVLIASLTTATYAWFTTSSQATISAISIAAADGAEVLIGVKTTSGYESTATNASFVSGSCSYGNVSSLVDTGNTNFTWAGDEGTAASLTMNISLAAISKATYTALNTGDDSTKAYSAVDTSFDNETAKHDVIKAEGHGDKITSGTIVEADTNYDYLRFTLGLFAGISNIHSETLTFFYNPTDNKTINGVAAAIHIRYRVNDGVWQDTDLFGTETNKCDYDDLKSARTASTVGDQIGSADTTELKEGWAKHAITITAGANDSDVFKQGSINQIEIYVFYDGTDSDCVDAGLGVTGSLLFYVTNANYTTTAT